MPYIGHAPTNSGNFYILDDFNGLGQDGSSSTYDQNANGTIVNYKLMVAGVAITPNVDNLIVTIDGVLQHPTDAYTISGSILTFTGAPASGVDFHVVIMGQSSTVGEGSIGADELQVSGDGTNNQLLKSDGDGTMSWINQNTVTASTAATLATARTIGGVSFDGSANIAVTLAATATTLATARAINGVNFDGSAAITVTADANTLSGSTLASGVTASSLESVGTLTSLTGGTGDFNWDSGTLFVDSSANAVGIGTTTPDTGENAGVTPVLHIKGDAPSLRLQEDDAGTGDWQIYAWSNSLVIFDEADDLPALTIDTSQNAVFAGNVDVGGSASGETLFRVLGGEGGNAEIDLFADQADNDPDKWKMFADTSGNLSIATKASGSYVNALQINSSANASFAGDIKFTGTTAFNIGSRSSGASAWLGLGGSLNNLKIGASDFTAEIAEFDMSAGTSCLTITKTGLSGYTAPIIDATALSASGDAYIRSECGAFNDAELGYVGKNNNATWITGYMANGSSNWQLYNAVGGGGAVITAGIDKRLVIGGSSTEADMDALGLSKSSDGGVGAIQLGQSCNKTILWNEHWSTGTAGTADNIGYSPVIKMNIACDQGETSTSDQAANDRAWQIGLNLENNALNHTYAPFITWSRKSASGNYNSIFAAIGAQRTGAGGDSNWNIGDLVFYTQHNPSGASDPREAMRLASTGNITGSGNSYHTASDERLKKNISTLSGSLDKVNQMRGVQFKWKKEDDPFPDEEDANHQRVNFGFIAQELEAIVPEVINTHQDTGIKTVQDANQINAVLVEAIKELSAKVTALENA
jgi:hypothetical protein